MTPNLSSGNRPASFRAGDRGGEVERTVERAPGEERAMGHRLYIASPTRPLLDGPLTPAGLRPHQSSSDAVERLGGLLSDAHPARLRETPGAQEGADRPLGALVARHGGARPAYRRTTRTAALVRPVAEGPRHRRHAGAADNPIRAH